MPMECNAELAESLQRFRRILILYDDSMESLPIFTSYVRSLLQIRTKGFSLPTLEIMSVMREEKPNIVYYMRHYSPDDTIRMLSLLKMDYKQAKRKLEQLSEYRSITKVKRFRR
ncbi:hypothetical protein ACFQPF_08110 [Fictibacillus iocasae]|uniref:Uncharacterized protein n=1 Tax=Fictibacillus iocasae TaxID=2715437 RepID=A0ABW2NQY1_9BACL